MSPNKHRRRREVFPEDHEPGQLRSPPSSAPVIVHYDNRAFEAYGYGYSNQAHEQSHTYTPFQDYDQDYYDYQHQGYQSPHGHHYLSGSSPRSHDSYRSEEIYDEVSPIEKKRKCRDVICLCFLFVAIVLMSAISAYAYLNGDLRRFTNGVDLNCDICGIENELKPGIGNSGKDLRQLQFLVTQKIPKKRDNFRFPSDELQIVQNLSPLPSVSAIRKCDSKCPSTSKIILNRCVNRGNSAAEINRTARINVEALTLDDVTDAVDDVSNLIQEIAEDLESSWKEILWICLISLGVAILVTILLRLFAGIIIWLIIIIVSLASIGGSVALWLLWVTKRSETGQGQGSWTPTEVTSLLVGSILVSILTILLLIVLIFMRKRIALVIQLFNEAGKAVHAMPIILLQPIITFLALGLAIASYIIVAILIETSGIPTLDGQGQIQGQGQANATFTTPICQYKKDMITIFSRWWSLFMVTWLTQFMFGCQHLVIAGAICTWYFTRDKSRLGFPISLSYKRLLRYHLGSVAFGSLIIAIVKMIRYVLTTIQNRFGGKNPICRAILWSFQCFTWCLEKFLIFLNANAYIEVAIYGHGFCKSARKAFSAITNNALRLAAINTIGDFVLFLAKLSIVALSVFIGYELLIKGKEIVRHMWVPLSLGGIFAYFVAHCFISVYEMAIDTVFLCFCEDCELNDGQVKPYYMTKGLMEFVKNSEKALAEAQSRSRNDET